MSKSLPSRPNLEQLKNQAKELLKSHQASDAAATERFRQHHPEWVSRPIQEIQKAHLSLVDAQLVIAREYGFTSWPKLKAHVQAVVSAGEPMQAFQTAVLANDTAGVTRTLQRFPELRAKLNDPLPEGAFGSTPLLAAVQRQNKEMIDLLLQAGADINARSHWWAGSFGVLDNDRGLAPFLIERGAVVDVHAAARLDMLDRLKELVSAKPELVHARGGDGQTPLHFAATVEIAEYLLGHGSDIDARDVDHEGTPAQWMIRERQMVARYLVQRGCQTDILMAAALGDVGLVHRHLEANPDRIRVTVSERFFPMRDKRAGGHIYIWTLGAHKTPHMVAREFGHEEVLRLLLERSPAEVKLAQACELGDEALFHELLAARPNPVQTLSEGEYRKVVDAAQNNNTQAVRLMLSAGWPVDARGQHGATPLHWAAYHGNAEMARVILSHHPPLECRDASFDGTPLGWAIHGSEHGWHCKTGNYPATVEALLQAGARRPEKVQGTDAVKAVLAASRKSKAAGQATLRHHRGHMSNDAGQAAAAEAGPKRLLETAQSIMLVDWPSTKVPRALLQAGLTVFGCSPHQFSRAALVSTLAEAGESKSVFPPQNDAEQGYLVFHRLASRPAAVTIVAVYRPPAELPGIIAELALPLGATVLWLLRPVASADERALVEKHGLILVENCDIAQVAQSLPRSSA
jgi:ankyrin repeat protein/predicted CoA-binding protein